MIANWLFFGATLAALFSFCLAMNRLRPGLAGLLVFLFLIVVPISLGLLVSLASEFGELF